MRWGIFTHDPDGDMGYGCIVGPFYDDATAERKVRAIRRAAERDGCSIECIILPIEPSSTAARGVPAMVR